MVYEAKLAMCQCYRLLNTEGKEYLSKIDRDVYLNLLLQYYRWREIFPDAVKSKFECLTQLVKRDIERAKMALEKKKRQQHQQHVKRMEELLLWYLPYHQSILKAAADEGKKFWADVQKFPQIKSELFEMARKRHPAISNDEELKVWVVNRHVEIARAEARQRFQDIPWAHVFL